MSFRNVSRLAHVFPVFLTIQQLACVGQSGPLAWAPDQTPTCMSSSTPEQSRLDVHIKILNSVSPSLYAFSMKCHWRFCLEENKNCSESNNIKGACQSTDGLNAMKIGQKAAEIFSTLQDFKVQIHVVSTTFTRLKSLN